MGNEMANKMCQWSKRDWLICNDPLAYVERILEPYLKVVTKKLVNEKNGGFIMKPPLGITC